MKKIKMDCVYWSWLAFCLQLVYDDSVIMHYVVTLCFSV